jgi:predicted transglutaminase-like cysteine proteinase
MAETKRHPEGQLRASGDAGHEHAIPRTHTGRRLPPRISYRHLFVQIVALLISILAIVGILVSLYAYRQVDRTEQDAQRQMQQVSDTLRQTSATLGTVTTAAQQGASTVDESTQALTSAAQTVRATADRLDDTAGKINFTIPITNQKPLAGVDDNFRAEATQLRQFAVSIDQTSASFAKNAGNLRTIADQVNTVAKQVNDIGTITDHFAAPGSGDIAALARDFRIVLLWSVVVHIMLLLMCIALIVLTSDHWTLAHLFRRRAEPPHAWFDPERGVEGNKD